MRPPAGVVSHDPSQCCVSHNQKSYGQFPLACSAPMDSRLAIPVGEETQVEEVKLHFRVSQYHHTRSFQKYPSQPPFWKTSISVGRAEGHLLTPGQAFWIQSGRIFTTLCWLQARCKLFLEKKRVPHASRLKRQPQAGTLTPAAAPSHWKPGLHLHSWPSPVTHTLSNDVLIKVVLAAL